MEKTFVNEKDRVLTSNTNINHEKLKEIEKLQKQIFNSNFEEDKSTPTKENKLNEHGHFMHDLSEYNIRAYDIIPLYLIKHHSDKDIDPIVASNSIPIISNIIRKDKDSIEITRVHLYKDYINQRPYSTEKISIKRNPTYDDEEVFISYFEDKLKKEISTIKSNGKYIKVVKFKKFRNPNELLFLQNIYYYRCILDTYIYYRFLNKIQSKKDFKMGDMMYNEYIKNLF